jgi:hypothetical protein
LGDVVTLSPLRDRRALPVSAPSQEKWSAAPLAALSRCGDRLPRPSLDQNNRALSAGAARASKQESHGWAMFYAIDW